MKTKKILAFFVIALTFVFQSYILVSAQENTQETEKNVVYFDDTNNKSDYVPITIDGDYSDWEDKPYTKIHYSWDQNNSYHQGALFRDENYVYLHIKMSNKSYQSFQGNNYRFTVDGTSFYVQVEKGDKIGQKNKNFSNYLLEIHNRNGYALVEDSTGVLSQFENNPNENSNPNAVKQRDEWEIKIPLSFFSQDIDTVKEITFYCSNLGPQEIIATGTPTLPFLVAGAGLIFASTSLLISKRKKKK